MWTAYETALHDLEPSAAYFPGRTSRRPDGYLGGPFAQPIRLLLVDDQILRRGLLAAVSSVSAIWNRCRAQQNRRRRRCGQTHRANVALLDAAGPGNDSITVTTKLRTSMPECRVVMLTTYGGPYICAVVSTPGRRFALKAVRAAARGCGTTGPLGLRVVDANLAAETLQYSETPLDQGEPTPSARRVKAARSR